MPAQFLESMKIVGIWLSTLVFGFRFLCQRIGAGVLPAKRQGLVGHSRCTWQQHAQHTKDLMDTPVFKGGRQCVPWRPKKSDCLMFTVQTNTGYVEMLGNVHLSMSFGCLMMFTYFLFFFPLTDLLPQHSIWFGENCACCSCSSHIKIQCIQCHGFYWS